MSNYVSNYISNLYNFYKSTTQKNQSLTDILTNFSQISKDYKDIIKEKNIANNQYHYSSYNFVECTNEEQLDFINNQLQLIESLVTNSIYEKNGMIWNWYDIFNLITNTEYANTEKWKILDSNGEYADIYNRFCHIGIEIIDGKTEFELIRPDYIHINLNIDDLKKIGIKYVVTQKDYTEYHGVAFEKAGEGDGWKIYRLSY